LLKYITVFRKCFLSISFADVITKFSEKLKEIESEVGEVLKLEAHEREILKSENQILKGERLMKGDRTEKRVWFQTKQERESIQGSFYTLVSC